MGQLDCGISSSHSQPNTGEGLCTLPNSPRCCFSRGDLRHSHLVKDQWLKADNMYVLALLIKLCLPFPLSSASGRFHPSQNAEPDKSVASAQWGLYWLVDDVLYTGVQ